MFWQISDFHVMSPTPWLPILVTVSCEEQFSSNKVHSILSFYGS